ncbi:MAG TPA: hypothetical protein VN875_03645 [Candidatus Binatus sp.]|jgi:hypothetical protein|nr:hypothetical protein [Candidatus Binatus sp.]
MVCSLRWKFWKPSFLFLLIAGFASPPPANAQGFVNAIPARARVFPEISSGVTAMKRDTAGHYYVLANPPSVIWIFDSEGKRIGQIPHAGAESAKIQYAADFDLDSDGRVLVADRAANAVEIFSGAGVLVAKIPVFAPTGIVGLSDHQFAVSTLRSKRLVEIRSDDGSLVRSFGELSEAGADPQSAKQLQNLGKVFGDSAGNIYFAFIALPDPTVRKYDRYGYAANDVTFDLKLYGTELPPDPTDRVQFGVNYSQTNFSDSYNTFAAVGNKGDLFFGGGLSPGLGAHNGEGPQTAQTATANILSTGGANGFGGGGPGGSAGGGMLSAQGAITPDSKQFHLGGKHTNQNSMGSTDEKSVSSSIGSSDLQFSAQSSGSSDSSATSNSDISFAELFSTAPISGLGGETGASAAGRGLGGFGGMAAGQGFFPGLGSFGQFGDASSQRAQAIYSPTLSNAPASNGAATGHSFERGAGEGHFGGPHGRFGEGIYNLTGTVKVNLDHVIDTSKENPKIIALGVDPVSQDMWAGIGRTLAHFDKNGDYLGDYFIATPEGALVRASAIIVEPDRLIVATDARGVYEFARASASGRSSLPSAIISRPKPPTPQTTPQQKQQSTSQQ